MLSSIALIILLICFFLSVILPATCNILVQQSVTTKVIISMIGLAVTPAATKPPTCAPVEPPAIAPTADPPIVLATPTPIFKRANLSQLLKKLTI